MGIESTAADYRTSMVKLSPTGPCWPTEEGTTWVTLLDALAQEYARIDENVNLLVQETFPDTTSMLLPNWERILGLPDIFSDPDATEEERRNTVLAKMRARGGQSADYLSGIVESLGYSNTIIDCSPFVADLGEADGYLFDATWIHYFIVVVHDTVPDHTLFEARFRSIQPAQSVSIFIYE